MRSAEELTDFCFALIRDIHLTPDSGFEEPEYSDEGTVHFFLAGEPPYLARLVTIPGEEFCRMRVEVECGNVPNFSLEQWQAVVGDHSQCLPLGSFWATNSGDAVDTLVWGMEVIIYSDDGVTDLLLHLLREGRKYLGTATYALGALEKVPEEQFAASSEFFCTSMPTCTIN